MTGAGHLTQYTVTSVALLLVLACAADARDRGERRKRGGRTEGETVSEAAAASRKAAGGATAAPATYLDTLNRGREVGLTEADLAPAEAVPLPPTVVAETPRAETSPPAASRDIFRIQCIASTRSEPLVAAKDTLARRLDLPVHVFFRAPYYKVLVGEFASRDEAERVLFDVQGMGYPDAFVVRSPLKTSGGDP